MSLDVYLYGPPETADCQCPHCDNRHTRERREEYFSANITHNLNRMAGEAGVYLACWRPGELLAPETSAKIKEQQERGNYHGPGGVTELEKTLPTVRAHDLIEPLEQGLGLLRSDPDRFRAFDAFNGWGTYDQFVPWVQRYLEACREWPDAEVNVSR
jgi:hypothetical protein